MSHLKKNVVFNYLGQLWRALLSLALVPVYISYLGMESYGLIGIYAMLNAWLCLLDAGIKPVLGREMARYTGGAHSPQSIRNILRTFEIIVMCIAVVVVICIAFGSSWMAVHWVKAATLSSVVVARAFSMMGMVTALQFVESLYSSVLAGLQRQVAQNLVLGMMATIRGIGAICLLRWVSPTIGLFFLWQSVVSLSSVICFAVLVYQVLPSPTSRPVFSVMALRQTWRFAAGMVGVSFLSLLLTQVDKIMLSRMLTLEKFGYYSLAGVVACSLYLLGNPIAVAFYPRFTELLTQNNMPKLRNAFHLSAQLVTLLMGSAAIILVVFSRQVLWAWTSNMLITENVAPILSLLASGMLLNGLLLIPYQIHFSHGCASVVVKMNATAVVVMVPVMLLIVPYYGALGAGWVWLGVNTGYIMLGSHFLFRRVMSREKWAWYWNDITVPLLSASGVALLCRRFFPNDADRLVTIYLLLVCSAFVFTSAALMASSVRGRMQELLFQRVPLLCGTIERK